MTKIVCAAFVQNQKVLLVRRAAHRKWYPNHWDLVGGHVDNGEQPDDAVVRESVEEVGLRPTSFKMFKTIYEADDKKEQTPFHVYMVTGWTGKNAQLLGDEHSELGWFSLDKVEAMDIALDGYRSILRHLLLERP